MRATYESDTPPPCHQSPVTKSPFAEVQLIPQTDILGGVRMVHPDDYEFNSPTDFGAYAVAKHPSLVSIFQPLYPLPIPPPPHCGDKHAAAYCLFFSQAKHYVLDFFKLHNAQMIRDVTDFRRSLMKRNAKFFDWFVDNVGIENIQMMHKKPKISKSLLSSHSQQSDSVPNEGNLVCPKSSSPFLFSCSLPNVANPCFYRSPKSQEPAPCATAE